MGPLTNQINQKHGSMARRKKEHHQVSDEEFPLLNSLTLYASNTTGDGNCLFRALSDQIYGNEGKHAEIRNRTVAYLKDHAEHFSAFIGEYGETWDKYIVRMARDGTYGGHLEIVAFAETYGYEIIIYQADFMYAVQPSTAEKVHGKVHIAYHTWEHYSSVRNKNGPHQGLPEVNPVPNEDLGQYDSVIDTSKTNVARWQVEIVLRSVPDASENKVYEMLQTRNYEDVIEELLMQQFNEDYGETSEQGNADTSPQSQKEIPEDRPGRPDRKNENDIDNDNDNDNDKHDARNPKKTAKQKRIENRQNKLEKKSRRSKASKQHSTPAADESSPAPDSKPTSSQNVTPTVINI